MDNVLDINKDIPLNNIILRDNKIIHAKRNNMLKEYYQRIFFEEIVNSRFSNADYLPTRINGKYVDYSFDLPNEDSGNPASGNPSVPSIPMGLSYTVGYNPLPYSTKVYDTIELGIELKNINPNGKVIGYTFAKREIVSRFTDEDIRALVISCKGFSEKGLDLLRKENIDICLLPYQILPSMSFKEYLECKRILVIWLSKYLEYNPYHRMANTLCMHAYSGSQYMSISISIVKRRIDEMIGSLKKNLTNRLALITDKVTGLYLGLKEITNNSIDETISFISLYFRIFKYIINRLIYSNNIRLNIGNNYDNKKYS